MADDNLNCLYYGDNLDIMRRYIPDESVDLVYLDPPFNSNANYNVLFAEKDGSKAASQIQAFTDTWTWDQEDESVFAELVTAGGRVADCLEAFRKFLGPCDMLAYLVMMAPRLVELRRVMKPTASIYLHCDPTASHYLKMLMDAVFGARNFLSEVVWKRTSAHSSAKRFGPVHDVMLLYTKFDAYVWNQLHQPYEATYVEQRFKRGGERPWKDADITGAGVRNGETGQIWRGFDVTAKGRHWAYPPSELDRLDASGKVYWPKKKGGWPRLKKHLDEADGVPLQDVWTDIFPLNAMAQERLGYPTQKPVALLERIIQASSNPGDLVLDPFCGCGTTIAAAQKLGRRWIGIDITHLAITLMKQRLKDAFGVEPAVTTAKAEQARVGEGKAGYGDPMKRPFRVMGEPVSAPDAAALAAADPYQFQWWALGLVGARPVEGKKGADKGIDGKIVFQGDKPGQFEAVVISVKAGNTGVAHVRDLRGVLDRDKAALGVLITMQEHTGPMREEAVTAGFSESATWGRKYPKIQLLTVADLLDGKKIDMPPIRQVGATFKKAGKVKGAQTEQQELLPG